MSKQPKRTGPTAGTKPSAQTVAAVYRELLAAHERGLADGKPWLTAAGLVELRRLVRARERRQARATAASPGPWRPLWNGDLGELWWDGRCLLEIHPDSYPAVILAAFQAQGWGASHIADPLTAQSGDAAGEARERLENAVKNLNRKLPPNTLHFRLIRGGTGVRWEYAAAKTKRGGRKRKAKD